MLPADRLCEVLEENGVDYYCGVPDSLLKHFCNHLCEYYSLNKHLITANEGSAIALAAGRHLAGGGVTCVYLQNSGQGNTLNPLLSLADPAVYGIPMLLMVGWRGEPGLPDEPQHLKQGLVSEDIFDAIGIPCFTLLRESERNEEVIQAAADKAKADSCPVAILVAKDVVSPFPYSTRGPNLAAGSETPKSDLLREDALNCILDFCSSDTIIVATTGKTSRELFELREMRAETDRADFLTVGSMGHASAIALGIALKRPDREVLCLDGDGAALMHLGHMAIVAQTKVQNFRHIVLNNGAHESVGGQATAGAKFSFAQVAESLGYVSGIKNTQSTAEGLVVALESFFAKTGPVLLEIPLICGSRPDLGRPTSSPKENKERFMALLGAQHRVPPLAEVPS